MANFNKYYEWFTITNQRLQAAMTFKDVKGTYLENAYLLFHHPRNKMGKKKPWKGYVIVDKNNKDIPLQGLTEPLKKIFYPYQRSPVTGGAKTGGSARGNITDRELANLINSGVFPPNMSEGLSIYAERVLAYLHKHDLQPFSAQHFVFDEALNIGTELDLLCIDNKLGNKACKNVVNIQLKTGFQVNYELKTGHFLSPYVEDSGLLDLPTNYKNIHQLQTFTEHIIVQRNYDNLLLESVVLVVSEEVTSKYKIDYKIAELEEDIYENLRQRTLHDETELEKKNIDLAAAAKKAKNIFK